VRTSGRCTPGWFALSQSLPCTPSCSCLTASLLYLHCLPSSCRGQVFRKLQQWEEAEKHLNTAREALGALTGDDSGGVDPGKGKAGKAGGLCCGTCLQMAAARLAVCQGDLGAAEGHRQVVAEGVPGQQRARPRKLEKGQAGAEDHGATLQSAYGTPRRAPRHPDKGAGRSAPQESIACGGTRGPMPSPCYAVLPLRPRKPVSRC